MSCQCYVTFDLALAFVFVLTFEHQSLGLGLGLELLSLESKPDSYQSKELDQRRLNTARRTTGAPFARFKFSSGKPARGFDPMKTSSRPRKA